MKGSDKESCKRIVMEGNFNQFHRIHGTILEKSMEEIQEGRNFEE